MEVFIAANKAEYADVIVDILSEGAPPGNLGGSQLPSGR